MREVLGVDIGGVIIDNANDGTDTSFLTDNYLSTTANIGAFDILRRLVDERFGENVFVVSKAQPRTQQKCRNWFAHHDFYDATGIKPDHIRFCLRRNEKAPICAELGVTHFIDDRLEVLSYLTTVGKRYLFRPRAKEVNPFRQFLGVVTTVDSWQEIATDLLP